MNGSDSQLKMSVHCTDRDTKKDEYLKAEAESRENKRSISRDMSMLNIYSRDRKGMNMSKRKEKDDV